MNLHLEKLEDLQRKRSAVHMDILKHILLIAASVFGILIALHTGESKLPFPCRLLFPLALTGISVGILFCSIALYGEYDAARRIVKSWEEELASSMRENREVSDIFVEPDTFYEVCEKAGYTAMAIALVLLVAYSFLLAF